MFIVTARLPKKKLLAGVITLGCCLTVVITALLLTAGGQAVSASAEVKGIRDNDDRIAFLGELGWQVSEQPLTTEELTVPEELDENYAEYMALQESQGFELEEYAGKRIKRYTYEILNYPTGETGMQVSLLIYKNKLIGGEVLSPVTGGFIHGLSMPDAAQPEPEGTEPPDENTGVINGRQV